jgi:hypothetical protein
MSSGDFAAAAPRTARRDKAEAVFMVGRGSKAVCCVWGVGEKSFFPLGKVFPRETEIAQEITNHTPLNHWSIYI